MQTDTTHIPEEEHYRQRAAQLRRPHGAEGVITAEWMNKGNLRMNMDTLAILDAQPGDSILEIGMGNGFFVKDVVSKHESITYTGCDFSELMVTQALGINAEAVTKGQVKFALADVAALPFADNSFNKAFTINTIYFWEDTAKVLSELIRVLQPEGSLIIAFRPKHQAEKYPFTKYGFSLYTKEDVIKLLSDNGFTNISVTQNREPDFEVNGEKMKMENVVVTGIKK